MGFDASKGIAYCGIACVLCEFEGYADCPGCLGGYNKKADDASVIGCAAEKKVAGCFDCRDYPCGIENDDCIIKQCARQRGIEGCYDCRDYPCGKDYPMLNNRANKAFIRYAHEFGKDALIESLRKNFLEGVVYQKQGTSPHGEFGGDYDACKNDLEAYLLLRYGRGFETKVKRGAAAEIVVKPLSPERADDFLDFFNFRAFTDNPPWGGCYCHGWQMTKEENKTQVADRIEELGGGQYNMMRALRETVRRQIATGAMRGYLAYADGVSIGWCNANDKLNFPKENAYGIPGPEPTEEREKLVVCFEIAPEYRGIGIASALLERVVSDAAAEGYAAVEGFARKRDTRDDWDFTGPARMYEKLGFIAVKEMEAGTVMKKYLAVKPEG
ncbi:MAG: GNAT family N-acetyltransferase [Defluviitaleaceae bacterium]|nr:GNAT family N-acetyltransferase [Defluviitaleaceae bacterium]